MITLSYSMHSLQATHGIPVFEWRIFRDGELLGSGVSIFDALVQIGGES